MSENNNAKQIIKFSGNKGEWSEIYIFLKLLVDGKLYAADRKMNRLPNTYLDVKKIIREEQKGVVLDYIPGSNIQITKNGSLIKPIIPKTEYQTIMRLIWEYISTSSAGAIQIPDADVFLDKIHITALKSPATQTAGFFGGTTDITMEVSDYRSGINSTVGFSCKSDLGHKATLINASGSTNFIFKLKGPITDELMISFNNIFDNKGHASINDRINFLKENKIEPFFEKTASPSANRNLILSGGKEMPEIVGALLKFFYWEQNGKKSNSTIRDALNYIVRNDVANYKLPDLETIYEKKLGSFLYDAFTGLRFGSNWDGRPSVNGGYIVVKNSGEIVAYHSTFTEQFKDFLLDNLAFESPSTSRHGYMTIYKENGEYLIKFNLQVRFR